MVDRAHAREILGRIVAGMEVCDVSGDKIGSIAGIYHFDQMPETASDGALEEIIEVKTGFLGLGQRFYLPLSVVQEVFSDTIFLSRSKEELDSLGYHQKPAHIA